MENGNMDEFRAKFNDVQKKLIIAANSMHRHGILVEKSSDGLDSLQERLGETEDWYVRMGDDCRRFNGRVPGNYDNGLIILESMQRAVKLEQQLRYCPR